MKSLLMELERTYFDLKGLILKILIVKDFLARKIGKFSASIS